MIGIRHLHEARLAVMMLTRVPVGRLPDPAPSLSASAWAFPLVGLIPGLLGWAVFSALMALNLSPFLAALVTLAVVVWITGALHEDGLADLADGLGGGRDKAHRLEIMRDSRIGSYGVVALVFMIALKAGALADLAIGPVLVPLLFTAIGSRWLMLATLVFLPPARSDGLGHGAANPAAFALLPGIVPLALLALFFGPSAVLAIAIMAAGSITISALSLRRIGGQTGDVLGAVQAVSETLGLICFGTLLA